MSKKSNLTKKISKITSIQHKYISILLLITVILILSGYFIFTNISSKKITTDNLDATDELTYKNNSEIQEPIDNNIIKNETSFHQGTLVNDNRGVPVLYYPSVRETADNEVTITPKALKTQLNYIKNEGYVTLTLSELKSYLLDNKPIPKKSIVITFDDGYMDNYYNAFPILKELNMVATIFYITSDIDDNYYLSKEAINEMLNYGIDIQSHTVNHPNLNKLTYDEQLRELKKSKKDLESITGKIVDSIAYPFGDFNDDSIEAAKAAGYTLGFTTKRGLSDRADNPLKLDRIYISSNYSIDTFKEILAKTEK